MPYLSQKIRLTPNKTQETLFVKRGGAARVAYNTVLSDFKAGVDAAERRSLYDLKRKGRIASGLSQIEDCR